MERFVDGDQYSTAKTAHACSKETWPPFRFLQGICFYGILILSMIPSAGIASPVGRDPTFLAFTSFIKNVDLRFDSCFEVHKRKEKG